MSRPQLAGTVSEERVTFRSRLNLISVCVACAFGVAGLVAAANPSVARACGAETYAARGVVKSFGPERKFVNIAHEKIDGYMAAMTMSFEPRTADQLAGLNSGDKVSFSFTATDDGRRLLNSVKKE